MGLLPSLLILPLRPRGCERVNVSSRTGTLESRVFRRLCASDRENCRETALITSLALMTLQFLLKYGSTSRAMRVYAGNFSFAAEYSHASLTLLTMLLVLRRVHRVEGCSDIVFKI